MNTNNNIFIHLFNLAVLNDPLIININLNNNGDLIPSGLIMYSALGIKNFTYFYSLYSLREKIYI